MPSGKYCRVGSLLNVGGWQLSDSKTAETFVDSSTKGGTGRDGGVRQWSGSISGNGHTPPVLPNQVLAADFYTYPDNGVEGTAGQVYSGNIIIQSVLINVNWGQNTRYSWVANYQGKPGLTDNNSAVPAAEQSSVPAMSSPCGNNLTIVDTPNADIPKLVSAALTITAALVPEANSSTISGGECWVDWSAGSIDWTLALQQQDYRRGIAGAPALGSNLDLQLNVNATEFWHLKYGRLLGYNNLQFSRSQNSPVSRTINIGMNSSDGTNFGRIALPGQTSAPFFYGE